MKYMLDTNICIYLLNKKEPALYERLAEIEKLGHLVGISAIVHSELQFGVALSERKTQNQLKLNAFLNRLEIFAYTESASVYYGDIRAELKRRGCLIGSNDLLIAAHALAEKATLITNNTSEFSRIKGFKLENWSR